LYFAFDEERKEKEEISDGEQRFYVGAGGNKVM
jgi:hypothetical protein